MTTAKIYGVTPSPFVRKVLVAMLEKGLDYELIMQAPHKQSAEYYEKSPLGQIPCYEDADVTLPDSRCITAYLEKKHAGTTPLYPANNADYGRCLWLDEYAHGTLTKVVLGVFFQRFFKKTFLNQESDEVLVAKLLDEDMPKVFAYLESQVPEQDWLFGKQLSIADITIGSMFVNFSYVGEKVDDKRWPKLANYVQRLHERDSFKQLMAQDAKFMGKS